MLGEAVIIVVSNALVVAGLGFLARTWVKARIESSVEHEYAKKLELFREEVRDREAERTQAMKVAALLSEWAKGDGVNKAKFNRLAWELSLWLPADLVRQLTLTICHAPGAPDAKQILVEIRKKIVGRDDGLLAENIVHLS